MRTIRNGVAAVALAVLASASIGQESGQAGQPQQAPPPAPAPAQPSAQRPAPPPAPSAGAPATGVVRGDEFIPTQELQADEEATFPVDI